MNGIELSDPGWRLIDKTVLDVKGMIDAIVSKMEEVLGEKAVEELCAKLGINSSGFLFIDPLKGYTRFFEKEGLINQKTYKTKYIWNNKDAGELFSNFVHWVFVQVRNIQQKENRSPHTRNEDYFRYLPAEAPSDLCICDEDKILRSLYCLHYVPLGEMLFVMLLWRCLSILIYRGQQGSMISTVDIDFEYESYIEFPLRWRHKDLFESFKENISAEELDKYKTAWAQKNYCFSSMKGEWSNILGGNIFQDKTNYMIQTVLNFAIKSKLISEERALSADIEEINLILFRNINVFLKSLGKSSDTNTVQEAIDGLEKYSRFPILPFFLWSQLDSRHKCYLVSPVWTSQRYHITIDDQMKYKCRHLGLALSAIAPLNKIDWTLSDNFPIKEYCIIDVDPLVIVNVIRLIARPLIEEHIFNRVFDEVKAAGSEKVAKYVTGVIEEKSRA